MRSSEGAEPEKRSKQIQGAERRVGGEEPTLLWYTLINLSSSSEVWGLRGCSGKSSQVTRTARKSNRSSRALISINTINQAFICAFANSGSRA